jgi:chaperonin cofactor prefoldin
MSKPTKEIDEETIKELTAVQRECEELQRQIVAASANLNANATTLRRSKITLKELDTLPPSTVTYKAIGRM